MVENLAPATWYFVATVVTKEGAESDFSAAGIGSAVTNEGMRRIATRGVAQSKLDR